MEYLSEISQLVLSIFAIAAIIKGLFISNIEKKLEPYYMKVLRRSILEIVAFLIVSMYIASYRYIDVNPEFNTIILYFLVVIILFVGLSLDFLSESASPRFSLTKYIRKFILKFNTIVIILLITFIIMLLFIFTNTILFNIKSLAMNITTISDLFKPDKTTQDATMAFTILILIYSFHRFLFTFPLNEIINRYKKKTYFHLHLQDEDNLINLYFISCNNNFMFFNDEDKKRELAISKEKIEQITITKSKL